MPTGYTFDVQRGKITSLREFALRCARNFGYLATMRDLPNDAPIPDRIEPDTAVYDKSIAAARGKIAKLEAMSDEDAELEAWRTYKTDRTRKAARAKELNQDRHRYETMLAKVRGWRVPTQDHHDLKRFMEEQLEKSIEFDIYDVGEPQGLTGKEWRAMELERAQTALASDIKSRDREIERATRATKWLATLRHSLPDD